MHAWDRESDAWPQADLAELAKAGAMRWTAPSEAGGDGLSPLEIHLRYEQIAAASVATALVLSQRDSAVDLIASAEESATRDELVSRLVRGEIFSTVGIAQLTTSRQG